MNVHGVGVTNWLPWGRRLTDEVDHEILLTTVLLLTSENRQGSRNGEEETGAAMLHWEFKSYNGPSEFLELAEMARPLYSHKDQPLDVSCLERCTTLSKGAFCSSGNLPRPWPLKTVCWQPSRKVGQKALPWSAIWQIMVYAILPEVTTTPVAQRNPFILWSTTSPHLQTLLLKLPWEEQWSFMP